MSCFPSAFAKINIGQTKVEIDCTHVLLLFSLEHPHIVVCLLSLLCKMSASGTLEMRCGLTYMLRLISLQDFAKQRVMSHFSQD